MEQCENRLEIEDYLDNVFLFFPVPRTIYKLISERYFLGSSGAGNITTSMHDTYVRKGCDESSEHCEPGAATTPVSKTPRIPRVRRVDWHRLHNIQIFFFWRYYVRFYIIYFMVFIYFV